jgi:uncharacterized protein YbaR (Trm112 family)/SAM-dependent methyltransferase
MLNDKITELLICPACSGKINFSDKIICSNCNAIYPIVDGIPILIDEKNSLFSLEQFTRKENATVSLAMRKKSKTRQILTKFIPSITKNFKAKENFAKFRNLLDKTGPSPMVLIIGGATLGADMNELIEDKKITFIESDILFGPRTQIIADAHSLPFANDSMDGVIIQAVLEHVVDPYRCVEEIHRVLKQKGIVYSETPFMQQTHMAGYDFTRFTDLGHRRLFRKFEEIERGIVVGPASALAWSMQYFLMSFTDSPNFKKIIRAISSLFLFWLKLFDYYLIHNISSYDAASGFYFIGRKTGKILSDKELINLYRGI